MNPEKLAEGIFEAEPNARYVALLDMKEDRLLLSQMRKGIVSMTEDETDRQLFSTYPPLVLRAVERLVPYLGTLTGILVRYKKVVLLFYRLAQYIVLISLDRTIVTPNLDRVGALVKRLEKDL